mgnify:CR=1 FL=1|tara:strand:+ start:33 stop:263 length:231 start_codon:yes stop_codon:yes gene_type:complete
MKKKNLKLNYLGLKCPLPVLKTHKVLKEVACDSVIEVCTDDPSAEKDFLNLCKNKKFKIIDSRKENKVLFLSIKKV